MALDIPVEFCSVMAGTPKVYLALCTASIYPVWSKCSGICLYPPELMYQRVCFRREVRKRSVPRLWWEADLPLKERRSRLVHKREFQLVNLGRGGGGGRCSLRMLSGCGPTAFSTDCETGRFSSHQGLGFFVSRCSDGGKQVRLHRDGSVITAMPVPMIRGRRPPAWWYTESKNWARAYKYFPSQAFAEFYFGT